MTRYEYFKKEIERWKVGNSGPEEKIENSDQSISWHLEGEESGVGKSRSVRSERSSHKKSNKENIRHSENKKIVEGKGSNRKQGSAVKKPKERILDQIIAEETEDQPRGGLISSHPLEDIALNEPENRLNIFKQYHERCLEGKSATDSNRKDGLKQKTDPNSQGSHSKSSKKLEIPSNLNLKESQVDFLRDVQNVLILFSDLKSKVERLNKVKHNLKEDLRKSVAAASKYRLESQTKGQQLIQAQSQLNASQQENQVLIREMKDLKAKLTESQDADKLKAGLQAKEMENTALKLKMKQLQVDQNVLQEIIKEMIYDKEKQEVSVL